MFGSVVSRQPPMTIPRIGLGCMALTGLYGPITEKDAIAIIHCAIDHGISHFDTAELYGPYTNETLLAEALRGRSHAITIATKVGYAIVDGAIAGIDNSAASLRSSVDGCLRRLRRDRIDLLYLHRVDTRVPVEDTVGVLADLVARGKVTTIGLSAVDGETLKRAHAVHPIAAVQNEYSLIARAPEADVLPRASALDIAFVAFSPLGRGLLSGHVSPAPARDDSDYRKGRNDFSEERVKAFDDALTPLYTIARQRNSTPAQVALAWLFAQSVCVIPGARTQQQVIDCCRAREITLTVQELAHLARLNTTDRP